MVRGRDESVDMRCNFLGMVSDFYEFRGLQCVVGYFHFEFD